MVKQNPIAPIPAVRILLATLFCLSVGHCQAQEIYFKSVRVFDGSKIIESTNVVVADGKIAAMGAGASPSEKMTIVEGGGKTLIPGLIDCHTHAFFEAHLKQAFAFGVTTELDMMSMPRSAEAFRSAQSKGQAKSRADFFSAGAAVTVPKGHGTEYGFEVPTLTSAEDADVFVKARVDEGSDYIKIIYDDGATYGVNFATLTPEMLKAAIDSAHKHQQLAVAHIGSREGARDAVRFGIDGLVHLFADEPLDDELLALLIKNKTFVVPTACVVSGAAGKNMTSSLIDDEHVSPLLARDDIANLKSTFPARPGAKNSWATLTANIKKLHAAGVPILAGSDAPNPATLHGATMHLELELLVRSGLSAIEALAAATAQAAEHFSLDDRGKIQVGMRADLVLVNGNPTEDIKATRAIVGVWKAGHACDRSARIARVAKQKSDAKTKRADEPQLVSNFDSGKLNTEVGSGWQVSTDSIMGGKSTAKLSTIEGGARKTDKAMKIEGTVQEKQPAFSGTMYSPADTPMKPADLSGYRGISFWAKAAQERKFQVMVFTQSRGFQPSMQSFTSKEEWTQFEFDFEEFDGTDAKDVIGIWFGANESGNFELSIDEFTFEN